jgi:hypothetical protein
VVGAFIGFGAGGYSSMMRMNSATSIGFVKKSFAPAANARSRGTQRRRGPFRNPVGTLGPGVNALLSQQSTIGNSNREPEVRR